MKTKLILFCVVFLYSHLQAETNDPSAFIVPYLMFPGEASLKETPPDLVQASMTFMKQLASGNAAEACSWIPGQTSERPINLASSIIYRLRMKRAYFISISKGTFDDQAANEYYIISGTFVKHDGVGPFIYYPSLAKKLNISQDLPLGYGKTFFIDLWKKKGDTWQVYPIPFHNGVITESFLKDHTIEKNMTWITEKQLQEKQDFNQKNLYNINLRELK